MTFAQQLKDAIKATPLAVKTGTVSAHEKGFGFIVDAQGESHFVPPFLMKQFIPGDVVEFAEEVNPRDSKLAVASMTLISRPETFWLGQLKLNFHKKLEFAPDEAVHVKFRLPANHGIPENHVFQVRVAAGTPPAQKIDVTIVQDLGPRNDREFDTKYATAKWRLPTEWPKDVQAEAQALANVVPALEAGMLDMRDLEFVTIDGESTRDYDDAVFAVPQEGGVHLKVAIADVSRYVTPGSALDREAKLRGTSVYFPDRVIPMLPEVLSNGLCSLNPGEQRAALVCSMDIDANGRIQNPSFARALIVSHARLTYNQVTAFVNGEVELPANVAKNVLAIKAVYDLMAPLRESRGLMEYRSREPKLVKGDDGSYNIGWETPTIAHTMVEECMLAANQAAALFVPEGSKSRLFRHHPGLDEEKWAETYAWLRSLGITLPEAPTLNNLGDLLRSRKDDASFPLIEWRVRRSFAPAVYDETDSSHFTLGFPAYTHFTSPIRRYSDLIVHRLVLGEIAEAGDNVALECSERSRRAQFASRYPMDRLKRRALWKDAQKTHGARIATLSKRGSKVVVDEWETAVFVPAEALAKIGYSWDGDQELWTRGGENLDYGQIVQVTLTSFVDDGAQCELEGTMAIL